LRGGDRRIGSHRIKEIYWSNKLIGNTTKIFELSLASEMYSCLSLILLKVFLNTLANFPVWRSLLLRCDNSHPPPLPAPPLASPHSSVLWMLVLITKFMPAKQKQNNI
jgi:hypothetical protein